MLLAPAVPLECHVGLVEQRALELDERAEIDPVPGKGVCSVEISLAQKPQLLQFLKAQQKGVSRERGEALVRRIAVARGPEGEDLPEALAGLRQHIEEADRLRTELSDAMRAGQAGRVQQDARRARAQGSTPPAERERWGRGATG